MHHALEIQEVLSVIFFCSFCSTQVLVDRHTGRVESWISDLPALARTCRTFKEPALDILWSTLSDLSPLARCLPEASHRSSSENTVRWFPSYSFTRPLTQTEWNILQSYTRRIRYVNDFNSGLDWKSVATFLDPPTTAPIFPKLHILSCKYTKQTMSLLHLPLPSLVVLSVEFETLRLFQNSLELFPNFSPNIRKLFIVVRQPEDTLCKFEPNYICRWKTLWSLNCSQVVLDVDALIHLSSIPGLSCLTFAMDNILPASDSPLVFSDLWDLSLQSKSLEPISRLLSQTRLPALTDFCATIDNSPFRQELTSFFAGLPTSNTGHTLGRLQLTYSTYSPDYVARSAHFPLDFEDLRPCMVFSNLRVMDLNVECNVDLTNKQVLALVSAWPKLESLSINDKWGWNSTGGITPGGLVQLLQICPSLHWIALRLDTRGYTEVPANLGWTPSKLSIDVLDAGIEAESVQAVVAFFCALSASCPKPDFRLNAWDSGTTLEFPNVWEYAERWQNIRDQVDTALGWTFMPFE